jgi:hypothetical protein
MCLGLIERCQNAREEEEEENAIEGKDNNIQISCKYTIEILMRAVSHRSSSRKSVHLTRHNGGTWYKSQTYEIGLRHGFN